MHANVADHVAIIEYQPDCFWLLEQDEPYCQVNLYQHGAVCLLMFTVHCSATWAGVITAALATVCDDVRVSQTTFIQAHDGTVRTNESAHSYWHWYREHKPLLSPRFTPPQPYPC